MAKATRKLTTLAVEAFRPRTERYEKPDGTSGLRLIVYESGAKSWAVRYRRPGTKKPAKFIIGQWPATTLAEARAVASAALLDVERGVDPAAVKQAQKKAAKAAATNAAADTIERWAGRFFEQHVRKLRPNSQAAARHVFNNIVVPAWRGRTVHDIARKHVRELVNDVATTRPISANRTLAHLSTFFKWLVDEDVLPASPAIGIKRPAPEVVRDRILTDDEIRRFWKATEQLSPPFDDIYRLLLLSAARKQEVGEMKWSEIDPTNKVWTIAAGRAKGKLAVALPLGPMAWGVVTRQPHVAGSDFVFGHRRVGFSHMKTKLDEIMKPATPWVNHDLRRTARSLLSRARVNADIAELAIGHVLPGAMRRVYDRFEYVDEKRHAFAALEREIDLILNPPTAADVIQLRG